MSRQRSPKRSDGLRIHVLGPLEVAVDGAPLVVDTRKALAILALLAVERRPFAREELAALLWPDSDDESARGALRRTLSVLRASLGETADERGEASERGRRDFVGHFLGEHAPCGLRGEAVGGRRVCEAHGLRQVEPDDDGAVSRGGDRPEAAVEAGRSIVAVPLVVEREVEGPLVLAWLPQSRAGEGSTFYIELPKSVTS